jgi:ABC-type multidrug transport system ATPase subunit
MNININNLSITYDGLVLFEDVSFEVPSGQVCCISGPSGCGKSSLLGTMLGFVTPQQGAITIDGTAVDEKSVWQLRHKIAYVPQEPDLGQQRTLECIRRPFAYKANAHLQYDTESVRSYFERFKLPAKLLDKFAGNLSGGEKQRVAIIIALLLDRPVLLLDEPTSALDKESRRILKDILSELQKTIVCISHDEFLLDIADVTIELAPAGGGGHE